MNYLLDLREAEARAFVYDLRNNEPNDLENSIADQIERQLPLPVPTKIGAVVRTERGTLIRVAPDGGLSEWWLMNQAQFSRDIDLHWIPTDDLGQITEVLSEGVDL